MPLSKGRIPPVILPDRPGMGQRSAFARGPKERRLRVVVDSTTVPVSAARDLLVSFGNHPDIDVYTTVDEGAPWLEIGAIDEAEDMAPVYVRHPEEGALAGVWPAHQYVEMAKKAIDAGHMNDEQEALRQLLVAAAAWEQGADALATESVFLLEHAPRGMIARSNPMTPESAAALVGLYLRSRADFTIQMWGDTKFPLGRLYWFATRAVLPAGWRWHSACVMSSFATGDDTLQSLGGAAFMRVDRALRARDRLHTQLQLPQDSTTLDEALFYLDVVLIQLMGAFDAVARVAHLTYGLTTDRRYASWRSKDWRREIRQQEPTLANLMDKQQPARDALELVALLRNSIHGEILEGMTFHGAHGGRRPESLLQIPRAEHAPFMDSVARLGGKDHWGVRSITGGLELDPDSYVEALVPAATDALNSLMQKTEVERLPQIQPSDLSTGPPEDAESPFRKEIRDVVRLLAGL
jgi:hypothetical protein